MRQQRKSRPLAWLLVWKEGRALSYPEHIAAEQKRRAQTKTGRE